MAGQERSALFVIDVEIPPSQGIRFAGVFLVSACGVVVLLPLLYMIGAERSPAIVIGVAIAGTILTILVLLASQRTTKQRRRTLHQLARRNRIDACGTYIAEQLAEANGKDLIRSALEILIANGHYGACLRFRKTGSRLPDPSPPLEVSFPPVLLDEADIGFTRFAEGILGRADRIAESGSEAREEWALARRVRRNLAVNALGWGMRFLIGVQLILAVLESFEASRIDWRLVIWLAILFTGLFASETGILGKRHWFILPGGLLLRTPSRIPTRSSLALFDRRESALSLTESRLGSWTLCVANTVTIESTQVTSREADVLLRAWRSPLPLPPVEKLVDFT